MIASPDVRPKRILVYGVTGAGKSTLAGLLSKKLSIPWHSVDDLTFEADWKAVQKEEQRRRIQQVCDAESWIVDSAYAIWLDIPLATVDLVVGLDYPRWLSLSRLVRRTAMRIVDGRLICNGNRETLRGAFSRSSIVIWHFKSFKRKHDRMVQWATSLKGPPILLFKSPSAAARWVQQLGDPG